jgi:hypothetical protein
MAGILLGLDCEDVASGISGTGGIDWSEYAFGDIGVKSTEVLVVWPDCGRKGFELMVDIAVSEVRDP